QEEWILIHIEVQNYTDQHFASRMFQYYYRILDKYNKPITAFAIFADANRNFHPKYYEREFYGTRVYYSYNTFKIIDQDDNELEASNNPFTMAVLTAKLALTGQRMKDEQLFERAYDLAKRLLVKQIPKDKIRKLMTFLRHYVRFENQELIHKFEKEIAILTERSNTMGIEEFLLDRAKKEGSRDKAVAVAMEMKKDGIPDEQIAKFIKLSLDEIKKLSS
ncbi:MAG: hypothetical protein JWR09_2467, partial [Mucilaginibacter sp.]|nr:hypothetical protein [Mucilaginibacter sp.]